MTKPALALVTALFAVGLAGCGPRQQVVYVAGLQAVYFDDLAQKNGQFEFAGAETKQIDAQIDFDWGTSAPTPNVGADTFGVRWTGWLTVPKTDDYTFVTISDDGVRFELGEAKLINNWKEQSETRTESAISLSWSFMTTLVQP
jgi:hypothetical protein